MNRVCSAVRERRDALVGRLARVGDRYPGDAGSVPEGGLGVIRVLCGELEVVTGGAVLRPHRSGARVLALLVASGGVIAVEALLDRLWPDVEVETGRNRLNVSVHRLRRELALGRHELVVRRRNLMRLDLGERWAVDAWAFARLAEGDGEERLGAFRLYEADFCAAQFPYDDAFAEERRRLRVLFEDLSGDSGRVAV